MWDIRVIVELIKCFEDIQFTEQINGNRVILYTIFPLLNETFVREQIKQGLSEIWDMNNVLKSVSQENEQPNQ